MSGVICGIAEWTELILCVDVAHLYLTAGPSASLWRVFYFLFCLLFGLPSPVNTIRGDGSWWGAESGGSKTGREAKSRARSSPLPFFIYLFSCFDGGGSRLLREGIRKVEDATTCSLV